MPYYQQPDLQGQGFYNPNMKGPDFGQGVREIIGGLIEKKRYEQEQEKLKKREEFEMKVAKGRLNSEEARIRIAEQAAATDDSWRKAQIENLGKENRVNYPASTIKGVTGMYNIAPEEWTALPPDEQGKYVSSYMIASRQKTGEQPVISDRQKADTAWADDIYGNISSAIQVRQRAMAENSDYGEGAIDPEFNRLKRLMTEFNRLRSVLISREWTQVERSRAEEIMGDLHSEMNSPENNESPFNKLAKSIVEKSVASTFGSTVIMPGTVREIKSGENTGMWVFVSEEVGWRKIS